MEGSANDFRLKFNGVLARAYDREDVFTSYKEDGRARFDAHAYPACP